MDRVVASIPSVTRIITVNGRDNVNSKKMNSTHESRVLDSLERVLDRDPIVWAMLVIEILVLSIIAYQAVRAATDRFRIGRRKEVLLKLMSQGQAIFQSAPHMSHPEMAEGWNEQVDAWRKEAESVLSGYSPQAVEAFKFTGPEVTNYNHIAPGTRSHYGAMMARLENLRNIMENPDLYY
jgi:hypothetical protein